MLTIEALRAGKGDCLILRRTVAGERDSLVLIDGGAPGTFRSSLKRRLDELRASAPVVDGEQPPLVIDAVIVSHIDDDHIAGILDLTDHLIEQPHTGNRDYAIRMIWHNSFEKVADAAVNALEATYGELASTASIDEIELDLDLSTDSSLILASVPQGRRLADNARALHVPSNAPWTGLVRADDQFPTVTIAARVTANVLWPTNEQLDRLHAEWRKVEDKARLSAAAFTDDSVWNLSSIVVLIDVDGHRLLLTGDARGDHILEGARAKHLLGDDSPTCPVDVLKVPHHGSNRSNDRPFFDAFPASHYIISGNGQHGNPNVQVIGDLIASRRQRPEPFTIYLTYPPEEFKPYRDQAYPLQELRDVLDEAIAVGVPLTVVTPERHEYGIAIRLEDL